MLKPYFLKWHDVTTFFLFNVCRKIKRDKVISNVLCIYIFMFYVYYKLTIGIFFRAIVTSAFK